MRKTKSVRTVTALMFSISVIAAMTADIACATAETNAEKGFHWRNGAEVYSKVCSYCHESQVGPRLFGRELPPEYIRTIVRNGSRAMPSFRPSEIDDESLAKLAEYIQRN
ncbi:MAG: cytochrome C [Nitrosomonadales bacterium SCN 54-20]|nr:MAG: cytochrome C [Nitrosomonadales bacterium SCN 54-20]